MATAKELLGMISDVTDDSLVVNLDTRIISIPASISVLGVESDDDTKRLRFMVPKNYGEFDLSTFNIQVNFKNANGDGDFYLVDDIEVSDDVMTFTWLIDRPAFARYGDVDFSLCMKKFDGAGVVVKELNTAIATLPVLKGLETTKAVVENNQSAFDSVLFRLYAVEAATGNSANGYYTIASVKETVNGTELSIFGSDGISVATIRDGYTPGRGIDYWTEADKNEIESEVKTYVDTWAPRSLSVRLRSGDWNSDTHSQIVDAQGVTNNSIIFVTPDTNLTNTEAYTEHGVRCVEKGTDYLKFECSEIPSIDLDANVGIFYSSNATDVPEAGGGSSGSSGSNVSIGNVELLASKWVGSDNRYYQVVNIDGVTPNSQVDLTPSAEQLVIFYEKDLTFVTENEGGIVTVYAIGQKPENDYVFQVTITEVNR